MMIRELFGLKVKAKGQDKKVEALKTADVPIVEDPKKEEPKVEAPKVEDVGAKVKGLFDALSDDEKKALVDYIGSLESPKEDAVEVKTEDVKPTDVAKEEDKKDEAQTLILALSKRIEQLEKRTAKGEERIPIIKGEAVAYQHKSLASVLANKQIKNKGNK